MLYLDHSSSIVTDEWLNILSVRHLLIPAETYQIKILYSTNTEKELNIKRGEYPENLVTTKI